MKRLLIAISTVISLTGCDETGTQCAYIDGYGVQQICQKEYPDETNYFCSDVSTYMGRHLPNRIATKLCYNRLTKSERNEFWELFAYGVGYAKLRRYMYR